MPCPECARQVPAGAKFCPECGAGQPQPCPRCGTLAAAGARFCIECGAALAAEPAPPRPAERRQVTVMFCDLVDSTPLSGRLDPEDLREVLRAYQQACAQVVRRYGGYVARYFGDGLLVYFGYPQAHEDDAERAVRGGLEIIGAVAGLARDLRRDQGIGLQVRVGVHTGLVVAGDMAEGLEAMAVVGETPNIAARLQGLAEPDSLLISGATRALVREIFSCRDLGALALKGVERPVAAHAVLGVADAVPAGPAALIGRDEELALLHERWRAVEAGEGQAVLLGGEAGIGKSSLVAAFAAGIDAWTAEWRCSPYHEHSAFHPVLDWLQRDAVPGARGAAGAEKLAAFLRSRGAEGAAPLLADLMGLAEVDMAVDAEQQRRAVLDGLLAVWAAGGAPGLLVVEDLHWADPSTRELLDMLLERGPGLRLCLLGTYRPAGPAPWGPRAHLTQLTLKRLTREQVGAMVAGLAGQRRLDGAAVAQVVARADGVPLFAEELTRAALAADGAGIPATLQDSLTARLDRLGAAKEVAQLGAVLGREFPLALVREVSPLEEGALRAALDQLVAAELLYPRDVAPREAFAFKHALVQEAAYQSLLLSARQRFHDQVARVLVGLFPEVAEAQPEQVARHMEAGGAAKEAIAWWRRAGERAMRRSASAEALGHARRGLALLAGWPEGAERDRAELELQSTRGPALLALRGPGADEVGAVYARARALCEKLGEQTRLYPAFYGLWVFHFVRAELDEARDLGAEFLRRAADDAQRLVAHRALGMALFLRGEIAAACGHMEQCVALYDEERHAGLAYVYGQDPLMAGLCFWGWGLWLSGDGEGSEAKVEQALARARALDHPHSLAFALVTGAMVYQSRREPARARALAQEVIALAEAHGFPFWAAYGSILLGWALTEMGEGGIAELQRGMEAFTATGARLWRPYFLALLAEAHGRAGGRDEGLAAVAAAQAAVEASGERLVAAELWRIRGDLLQGAEARACYQRGLAIARAQGAKSIELSIHSKRRGAP